MAVGEESDQGTVAIILGAKQFPKHQKLDNVAFGRSAEAVLAYFQDGLKLRSEQILNLFDDPSTMIDMDERIANFLVQRTTVKNILVFYVGHGGFLKDREYYLAIHSTAKGREHTTGLRIKALAETFSLHIGEKNLFLILDCCFAGEAVKEFQSAEMGQLVESKTFDALPGTGTALLVAASKDEPAISPKDNPFTMFCESFLEVLTIGIPGRPAKLSLSEVTVQTQVLIKTRYGQKGVFPEVHSPRQRGVDVASIPIFPNAKAVLVSADTKDASGAPAKRSFRLVRPPLSDVRLSPAIIRELNDRLKKDPCTHAYSVATYETALFDENGNFGATYKTKNTMLFRLTRPTNVLQFSFQGGKDSAFSAMSLGCAATDSTGKSLRFVPDVQEVTETDAPLRSFVVYFLFDEQLDPNSPNQPYAVEYEYIAADPYPKLGTRGELSVLTRWQGDAQQMFLAVAFPREKIEAPRQVDITSIPRQKLKTFDYDLEEGEELLPSQMVPVPEFMDRLNLEYPPEKYFIVGRQAQNIKQGQSIGMFVNSKKRSRNKGHASI
jgi:hypothetical protein